MRAFLTHNLGALLITFLLVTCNEQVPMSPCVEGNSFRFQIDENSPEGALVGRIPVDESDQVRFFIHKSNAGNSFAINIVDGRIHVRNNALLNYEVNREFKLTVVAQSPNCATSLIEVTIQVSDLNE